MEIIIKLPVLISDFHRYLIEVKKYKRKMDKF